MDKEQLLKEIFELEPDLRTKETEVRTLVFSMLEHKPVIVPDLAMKAIVKARLLAHFENSHKTIKSPWLEWVWYAAPLGAVAVIIFMMVPSHPSENMAPYMVPPVTEQPAIRYGGTESLGAPAEVSPIGPGAAKMEMVEVSPDSSASDMRVFSQPVVSVSFDEQKPGRKVVIEGVFSLRPVFVGVYVVGQDEPLGVSRLVVPGNNGQQTITLNAAIKPGGDYEVRVYEDDGDGIFVPTIDVLTQVLPLTVLP